MKTLQKAIRVGAVGCGYWGPNLIRNLRQLPIFGSHFAALSPDDPDEILPPLACVHVARSVLADRPQGLSQIGLDEKIAGLRCFIAGLPHELLTFGGS